MITILKTIIRAILAIALLSWVFPSVSVMDLSTLVAAGIVLALLQTIVQPVLKLLFLPINLITLGIFSWAVNVFVVWLAIQIVPGFDIVPTVFLGIELGRFGTLILMTFMLSLAHTFVGIFIH